MSAARFHNRSDAGRAVAAELRQYANRDDVIVLALPRGGVPVAYEVATSLGVPLDVFVVRKIGFPGNEEFAIGALASGGVRLVNDDIVRAYGVSVEDLNRGAAREEAGLARG